MIKRTTSGRSKAQRARHAQQKYAAAVVAYGGQQKRLAPLIRRRKNIIKRMERDVVIEANGAVKAANREFEKLKPVVCD